MAHKPSFRATMSLAPGCDVTGGDPLELQVQGLPDENNKSCYTVAVSTWLLPRCSFLIVSGYNYIILSSCVYRLYCVLTLGNKHDMSVILQVQVNTDS